MANITARSAYAFYESLGINIHLGYDNTAYNNFDSIVKPRLLELGIKHVRDGQSGPRATFVSRHQSLGAAGLKILLLPNWYYGSQTPAQLIQLAKDIGLSYISAIEGLNEPDLNQALTAYNSQTYPNSVVTYHRELGNLVHNDAAMAGIPVISPSIMFYNLGNFNNAFLNDATIDIANLHPYPGDLEPDNMTNFINGAWDQLNRYIAPNYGNKPTWATETGIPLTEVRDELIKARYIERTVMHYFNVGYSRTYIYQLMNEDYNPAERERTFGLISDTGERTKSFYALKNLISILKDTASPSSFRTIDVTITGETTNLRTLLLQKQNNKLYFALWAADQMFNINTGAYLNLPSKRNITLTFPKAFKRINIYRPLKSNLVMRSVENSTTLSLGVPSSAVILEIDEFQP